MIVLTHVVAVLCGMFGMFYLIKRGWVSQPKKK